jgi:hypothetical protein
MLSYADKVRAFFDAFESLPLSDRFSLHEPGAVEGYDTIVIGSDEVWNLRHPWYGQKPIFYGAGLNAGKIVSYAASFGNHDVSEGLHPWWAGHLESFGAISVRDDNSRRLVREALGREPHRVLDPCLQFPDAARVPPMEQEEPYAVVYGHGFPAPFAAAARHWAGDAGLRLVSVGYRNDWADEQRLGAGPEAFASAMAGASAVITNFFHGCVFALLNGKPFATTPTAYRFNKVRDLTAAVGAQHHMLDEEASTGLFHDLLDRPLDPAIPRRIAQLRACSEEYLEAALQ